MDDSGMAAGVIEKIHFKDMKPNAQAFRFPWPLTLMLALDLRLWLENGMRAPSLQESPLVPLGPLGQFCDFSVCTLPWLTVRQIELEEFYGSGKSIMKVELLIHNTNKHWALIIKHNAKIWYHRGEHEMGKKINVERNEALWNEEMEDTGWAMKVDMRYSLKLSRPFHCCPLG